MSFLKGLGSFVGGTVKTVGQLVDIRFVEEIGEGVKKASCFTGDKLGGVASGTWDTAVGFVTQDEEKLDVALNDMGKAIGDTAKAAGYTVCHVVENGKDVVIGIKDGDDQQLMDGAKGLVKVGVVGALSFGVIDLVDGADGIEGDAPNATSEVGLPNAEQNVNLLENPNNHHVEPYWRTLADGTETWVDGDGDSSENTNEGWTQSNPDYRVKS